MKTKSHKMVSVARLSVLASLTTAAHAHPGASGHTHAEEWPFVLLAASLLTAGLYLGKYLIAKNNDADS